MFTNCTICRYPIKTINADVCADHYVYDFHGSVNYIELAHVDCAQIDNAKKGRVYWNTSPAVIHEDIRNEPC